jgi:hypothetical protein
VPGGSIVSWPTEAPAHNGALRRPSEVLSVRISARYPTPSVERACATNRRRAGGAAHDPLERLPRVARLLPEGERRWQVRRGDWGQLVSDGCGQT